MSFSGLMSPVFSPSRVLPTPGTRPTTMPAKMISEMPLPMPRSDICSPSHMMNMVPVVRVSTVSRRKPQPGLSTTGMPLGFMLSRPMAMPPPWIRQISTVP